MRTWPLLTVSLCALPFLAGGAAPAGEKADVKIEPGARKPDPLAKEISVEFKRKPLGEVCEVLAKLTGVKVTCDEELAGTPITLKLTKTQARLALKWFARMAGAGAEFRKDGSVRISRNAEVKTVRKVYDVRFLGSLRKAPGGTPKRDYSGLEEMIRRVVSPNTWGRNGRSVSARDGKLTVVQTEEVHGAIAKLLKDLRSGRPAKARRPAEGAALEFIETPAKDVVAYVAQRAGINIIVDPACKELMETKLTFKARGMKLREVLDWALRLSGAERRFKDGAIYVTPKGKEKRPDAREIARKLILDEENGIFRKPVEFKPPPEVVLPGAK